jgi:hypothetical protein
MPAMGLLTIMLIMVEAILQQVMRSLSATIVNMHQTTVVLWFIEVCRYFIKSFVLGNIRRKFTKRKKSVERIKRLLEDMSATNQRNGEHSKGVDEMKYWRTATQATSKQAGTSCRSGLSVTIFDTDLI